MLWEADQIYTGSPRKNFSWGKRLFISLAYTYFPLRNRSEVLGYIYTD